MNLRPNFTLAVLIFAMSFGVGLIAGLAIAVPWLFTT